MSKRPTQDDWVEESRIIGTGFYTNLPPAGKTKIAQIGFIRQNERKTRNQNSRKSGGKRTTKSR